MRLPATYHELFAPERRWLLAAAGGASFIAATDVLLVATALPSTARDLGGLDHYALVVGCYAAALAVGLPIGGTVVDRMGAWRSLAIGCLLFGCGGLTATLAPSMDIITVSRLVQGFAAGLLFAVPLAVVAQQLPERLRKDAYGLNAAVWSFSALAGPVLGAVLTSAFSWRVAFLFPVLFIAFVAFAGWRGLRGDAARPADPSASFHLLGPLLLGATVAVLLVDPRFAALLALAFLLSERRAREPVFPRSWPGRATVLLAGAAGVAFSGADGLLPLGLQVGLGWPILLAVVPLICTTAAWTIGSIGSAQVSLSTQRQMLIGTGLVGVGVLLMGLRVLDGLPLALGIVVAALGMGIQSPAALLSAAAERPGAEGRGTTSVPLARSLGGGIGIALAGAITVSIVGRAQLDQAEHADGAVPMIADAVQHADVVLAVLCLLSLPLVMLLRRDTGR